MATSIKFGAGFKVNSITLYAGFAQVNGEFIRDNDTMRAVGAGNSFTFNVSVEEAKQLTAGTVYDFGLVPQPKPTPDTTTPVVQPSAPVGSVA